MCCFFWWLSYAHEDETISSHIGREADRGNKKAIFLKKLINKIFFWQKDHCEKSIEKNLLNKGEQHGAKN